MLHLKRSTRGDDGDDMCNSNYNQQESESPTIPAHAVVEGSPRSTSRLWS